MEYEEFDRIRKGVNSIVTSLDRIEGKLKPSGEEIRTISDGVKNIADKVRYADSKIDTIASDIASISRLVAARHLKDFPVIDSFYEKSEPLEPADVRGIIMLVLLGLILWRVW